MNQYLTHSVKKQAVILGSVDRISFIVMRRPTH